VDSPRVYRDLGTWGLGDEIAEKFLADMEVR
jgi:hypothetical protein